MRWRRRNGTDVRKHLQACRDDLVALQRDARNLATGVTEVTRDGAGRAAKQASTALDYVSGQINGYSRQLNGYSRSDVVAAVRSQRFAVIASFAGAGAIIGALLTRR
ncbi:MAG TPA: hypothetical protein VKB71_13945 [Rhizomicrobium sp.]|nr:hypothetical protein [Rhizomicrobium sp.]